MDLPAGRVTSLTERDEEPLVVEVMLEDGFATRLDGRSLTDIVTDVNVSVRGWYQYFRHSQADVVRVHWFPSRSSPHSFLAGRGRRA